MPWHTRRQDEYEIWIVEDEPVDADTAPSKDEYVLTGTRGPSKGAIMDPESGILVVGREADESESQHRSKATSGCGACEGSGIWYVSS